MHTLTCFHLLDQIVTIIGHLIDHSDHEVRPTFQSSYEAALVAMSALDPFVQGERPGDHLDWFDVASQYAGMLARAIDLAVEVGIPAPTDPAVMEALQRVDIITAGGY